ncbi:MAG TPA: septum formation initiator family protein [Gemmatimonadales bacterium]|nr:septum formation initiator family protein [Gemmatimonadales bacterium]
MAEGQAGGPIRNWLVALALVGAGLFALLGGTYTTFDLFRLKGDLATEKEAIDQLKVAVDSLTKVAEAAERDPRVQERLARDQFGMIRSGEHLYRIVPAGDSTR